MSGHEPPAKRPKFQKLSPIEHVLTRPAMYTGGNSPTASVEWVLGEGQEMVQLDMQGLSKGLVSVIGELLVNMRDVVTRFPNEAARLSLSLSGDGWVTATNAGRSHYIEVVEHPQHGVTMPELVFTNLHAGSNFDDTEQLLTGGQNGLGAKLALIFSTEAVVEVGDPVNGKKFVQKVSQNMHSVHPARITSYKNKNGYVTVSVRPELSRFGLTTLAGDPHLCAVLKRRCLEIAACTPACVAVDFQGERLGVKDFKAFASYFGKPVLVHQSDRWRVAVFVQSPAFHFSVVNGIHTRLGGSHVKHIQDRLVDAALPKVLEKVPGAKAAHVRDQLGLVIACDLTNPRFTSQTKEELSMPIKDFGSRFSPDEKEIQKVLSGPSGLISATVQGASLRLDKAATKAQANTSRKAHVSVPKLDDATDAGTANNQGTVLQVTEGDSAKVRVLVRVRVRVRLQKTHAIFPRTQVVALRGMEVLGRQKYGSFPLRGKLLNAMKATKQQMLVNQELKYLMEILGLRVGTPVKRLDQLRYKGLLILTDADPDGKHIAGLILCFLATFWPELLRMGFTKVMLTPVVKAGSLIFYDLQSYRDWQASVSPEVLRRTSVRYYKGLGTSTAEEAKSYYRDIQKNLKQLEMDPEGMDALKKMFEDGKEAVERRKQWILSHVPERIDYTRRSFTVSSFINQHVIEFCLDDIGRSIMGLDGLKVTQRKILWALMLRASNDKPVKVCQLAGYVAERACYHHGEASLNSCIVGMNQDFVGKNQVALLQAHSNFGTRLMGGADASSPRYIDTSLSEAARLIFPKEDLPHLPQQLEDGTQIEPEYMLGVVPMILVNPSSGIAVGWNSSWPPFRLDDVVCNLILHIQGEAMVPMEPYFRGFRGTCEASEARRWTLRGTFAWLSDCKVRVTELPPGKWPGDQKEKLVTAGIEVLDASPNTDEVDMTITFPTKQDASKWVDSMDVKVSTAHMNIVIDGKVRNYSDPLQIIEHFAKMRLDLYEKRRQAEMARLAALIARDEALIQFIGAVSSGAVDLARMEHLQDVSDALAKHAPLAVPFHEEFMGLPMRSLTKERVRQLTEKSRKHAQQHEVATQITPSSMWLHDLKLLPTTHAYATSDEPPLHSRIFFDA
jgi:DNA topoisomerase-2